MGIKGDFMKSIIGLVVVAVGVLVGSYVANSTKVEPVEQVVIVQPAPVVPLSVFVQKVMDECNAKGSEAFLLVLRDLIADVAVSALKTREHQEALPLLICIESKFNPRARSSAGAVGLSQIMPKYAQEFATACGLGKLSSDDLNFPEINLRIGACHLARLLTLHEGSIPLALAAYNSGANSPSVKRLSSLASGNPETDGYLAKFSVLKHKTQSP